MSLELLKSVPCPAGDKCNAFHCLFKHPRDSQQQTQCDEPCPSPHRPQSTCTGARNDHDDHDDHEGLPRKRLKTDADSSPAGISSSSTRASPGPADASKTPAVQRPEGNGRIPTGQGLGGGAAVTVATPTSTGLKRPREEGETEPTSSGSRAHRTPSSIPAALSSSTAAARPQKRSSSLVATKSTSPSSFSSSLLLSSLLYSSSSSSSSPKTQPPKKLESLNPRLLPSAPAKHDSRLKFVKMLYQEFVRLNSDLKKHGKGDQLKLVVGDQDLVVKALDDEERLATQKPTIYANAIKHHIMHYKRQKLPQWIEERTAARKKAHLSQLSEKQGRQSPSAARTGEPKQVRTGLTPGQEVDLLRRHLLTPIAKHAQHGYVPVAPGDEDVEKARKGVEASKGWEQCDRCMKRFQVFPGRREADGILAGGGACTHHSGKALFPERASGVLGHQQQRQSKKWTCCGTSLGDTVGCTESPHHVFKVVDPKRLSALVPFAHTPENDAVPDDRAVCFDCEMAYTVHGLELVRVTATSWPLGETLLDVLVRPVGEILDLNSRYSGVWPEDMAAAEPWTSQTPPPPPPPPSAAQAAATTTTTATAIVAAAAATTATATTATAATQTPAKPPMKIVPSPREARSLLFSLISPSTPLIGHGLENDLNATRIIHPSVVDTVLLFPHRLGLPARNGLRSLADRHLNLAIQANTGRGHDSAEDARAAGELVRLKVGEQWSLLKSRGWTAEEGGSRLTEPGTRASSGASHHGMLSEKFIESKT